MKIIVWCKIKGSCLKIEGQDLWQAPLATFGEDEYEYSYNFDKKNTELLVSALYKSQDSAKDLKELLIEEFSGVDGCVKLRKLCEENKIEYEFFNWF